MVFIQGGVTELVAEVEGESAVVNMRLGMKLKMKSAIE